MKRAKLIEEKYGRSITRVTLSNIYKRNNIGNLKPGYKWHLGRTNTDDNYLSNKSVFLRNLMSLMKQGKQIIYTDETSTHMWEKKTRVWMPRDNPINMRLHEDRGKSRTITGAICEDWLLMKYMIMDKTLTETFIDFLKYICHKDFMTNPRDAYLVLDNHPVHKAKLVKEYAASVGLNLMYLPPTASELNPIERMWAYFKAKWRDMLSNHETRVNK